MATKPITDKTFEEITSHPLSNSSMLNLFNVLEDSDKVKFLNIFKPYIINTDLLSNAMYYMTYEVNDNDWYDQIAYKYYKDQQFWWLIALTNNVLNPFEELDTSMNLKVLKSAILPIVVREMKEIRRK